MKGIFKGLCFPGVAVLMVLVSCRAAAEAEWRPVVDGELTTTYDNNVSRAEYRRDHLHDETLLGRVGVSVQPFSTYSLVLRTRAFVEGEKYHDIDTLDRTTAGGQGILRWQPAAGFTKPVYQFSLTGQLDDYAVTQRDSMVYTAQAFASQHVNDRVDAAYGIEGVNRRSDGTVFDTRNIRLFLNVDMSLNEVWSAYTSYSYLHGDTFSSAQFSFCNGASANDIFGLIGASTALEPDEAFNQKFCGSWIAYRLNAHTNSLVLGVNRGFGHHLSADFSVQGVQVDAQGDNNYRRVLVRAGLLARF